LIKGIFNTISYNFSCLDSCCRGSIVDEVRYLKQRASQLIVQVPVKNLKKIANTDGIHSLSKETQHFCGICTMHGPLRAYRGKHYSRLFWTTMLILNSILLVWQTSLLLSQYFANPTASQVLFILPEDGISFPSLTICNYNAIRKSYVKEINISGDFSQQMLNYIKQSYLEADTFYANAQIDGLEQGMLEYNKNFSFHLFYNQSGFSCENMLKICTFGGKRFNCCELAEPILTTLGQCYLIQLSTAKDAFLQKQSQAGLERGSFIFFDSCFHLDDYQPFMSNGLVNGFRYFVHGVDEISYLSHEGISVSPGFSIDTFLLLDESQLGNCTNSWPDGYHSLQRYSAAKCRAFCRARYFNDKCNCSPFFYNIDNVCSPYETYMCIYNKLSDSNKNYVPPKCNECKIECKRWVYHSYNSYGQGFSTDMLKWLHSQNPEWTPSHVRKNFVTINIAYMDMSYTLYSQVQTKSITEILSNIGGNMGLFFGMSVLSCFEIIMYLAKMTWIIISRKRRQYITLDARNCHFQKTLENLESQTGSNRNAFFKNYITNRLYNDGPIDTFPNDVITGSDDLMVFLFHFIIYSQYFLSHFTEIFTLLHVFLPELI
uniref:Acid-sensing ion channel 5 n=1 Tax=Thelazia callipaeda TaxID=103827 RepID=A0A0N5CMT2_THECL